MSVKKEMATGKLYDCRLKMFKLFNSYTTRLIKLECHINIILCRYI